MPLNIIELYPDQSSSNLIKDQHSALMREPAFINDYIVRALKFQRNLGCCRINVLCTDQPIDREFSEFDKIIDLKMLIDPTCFDLPDEERKQYWFQLITQCLQRVCALKGWDFSMFQTPLDQLKACNLNVEYYVKGKSRRNGKYTAKIYCIHDMFSASYFVDFIEKRKVILRKPLLVTSPRMWSAYYDLGEFQWINETTVSLKKKYGDSVTCISMNEASEMNK